MKPPRNTVTVNLTPKQAAALDAKAKAEDRSMSSIMRLALAKYLEESK